MFRVSLPRKAKSELSRSRSALHDEGLDIESERAVKKPKLSVKTNVASVRPKPKSSAKKPIRQPKRKIFSAIQKPAAKAPIAVKLVPDSANVDRLEPHGSPTIWAAERQNLCEALPYYRAYQSAAYTLDSLAYGFLLDKDSSGAPSYMDEEIVITRAGGGCKTDPSGNMQHNQNQSGDAAQITSFRNCTEQKHAVALILGSEKQNCPIIIPHRYCVMDWFQVTDVWAEIFNGKVCYKFRFEKLELEKKSWWAPKGSPLPAAVPKFDMQAALAGCIRCHSISKEIYRNGWMCLNEKCLAFFTINGQTPVNLSYAVEFLNERSQWPKSAKPGPLKPEPFLIDPGNPSFNYSRASWKGMVCPQCGRCNSRVHWARWECQTQSCRFTRDIQLTPLSHTSVLPSHGFQGTGHAVPQDRHTDPVVLREPVFLGDWRIHTFEVMIGTQMGLVTHFQANSFVNQLCGGTNDIFRALQEADLGLQRFPLKSTRVNGEMLTKHFTSNYGMPYKYVVAVDSKPFKGAPKVIMDGLNRLTWAGNHTVGAESFLPFNELLALGYFEEQAIGYHDDGEDELGPTIATMSIGGEADMTIRMKEKYYSAKSKDNKPYDPDAPIIQGCQLYQERLELNALHKNGRSDKVLRAKEADLQREAQKIGRHSPPVVLNMKLHHGDMVVMHGREIQKYFEHSVKPLGKLRYALTARFIDPAKIDLSEHWKGDFVIDPSSVYSGDIRSLDPAAGLPSPRYEEIPAKENLAERTRSSSQETLVPPESHLAEMHTCK